jgi:hypothetical protein
MRDEAICARGVVNGQGADLLEKLDETNSRCRRDRGLLLLVEFLLPSRRRGCATEAPGGAGAQVRKSIPRSPG